MQVTQDYIQALLHNGSVFDVRHMAPAAAKLADTASMNILVATGKRELHVYPTVKAIGTMEIYGFATPTVSANGTELTPVSRHYENGHANVVETSFYHTPTITGDGTQIYSDIVPAGATQGSSSSGGQSDFKDGFILGPNSLYLLRVTNVSGAAAVVHVTLTAHEQGAD